MGVNKVFFKGEPYWRVRLGKRFTGGEVRIKHFTDLDGVRSFIFGDDDKQIKKTDIRLQLVQPGAIRLKGKLGSGAFELSSAQLAEVQNAYRRLPEGVSLTHLVDDWLQRRAPVGGVKTTKEVSAEFIISRRSMGVRPRTLVHTNHTCARLTKSSVSYQSPTSNGPALRIGSRRAIGHLAAEKTIW